MDPTRPDDMESSDRASDAFQLSPRRRLPLTIGTPDGVKDTAARRDVHRPSQSLASRLGAASPSTFDISTHSIIPDQMKDVVSNTPLTPRSEARRVRFLDVEEERRPIPSNLTHSLVQAARVSNIQTNIHTSLSSDEEVVAAEEQENPFTVSDDSEHDWPLIDRASSPDHASGPVANTSVPEINPDENLQPIAKSDVAKGFPSITVDDTSNDSPDEEQAPNDIEGNAASESDSSDSDDSEAGILALIRDSESSRKRDAELALRPSNKQAVAQPIDKKIPSTTVVSGVAGVWKVNAVPCKRTRPTKENVGWKEQPIDYPFSTKKQPSTNSSRWVIKRVAKDCQHEKAAVKKRHSDVISSRQLR